MSPPKEDQFSFQVKAFVLQNSIDYLHIKYVGFCSGVCCVGSEVANLSICREI